MAATLKKLIPQEMTYRSTPVLIPAPRFYMFYNGISDLEDKVTYRLSELFQRPVEDPSIELIVTCLNVNEGHNKELMDACKALKGYSIFVAKVRKYREEVSKVAILEYSAERHLQYEKEDSYNSGYNSGYDSGYNSGYDTGFDNGQASGHSSGIKDTTALFSWLKKNNREPDILRAIDNQDYLAALFHEFSKIKQ